MVNECQKVDYQTRSEALDDIKFMRAQQRHFTKTARKSAKTARKLRPYECPRCGKWHLTTQKQYRVK